MSIQLPEGVKENLRFLSVEVDSQVSDLQRFLAQPTLSMSRRIQDRAGYAFNLQSRIQTGCVNALSRSKLKEPEKLALKSVELVAVDLERIAELVRDCLQEMEYVEVIAALNTGVYQSMLEKVRAGIALAAPALETHDTQSALSIAELEQKIEAEYQSGFRESIELLNSGRHTQDLVRGLFVAHHIRQMASGLLQISESIISANLGQPMNLKRYHSLQALMTELDAEHSGVQVTPIAETRSGSAISGVTAPGQSQEAYFAVFKEGQKRKVKEERQGVRSWHEIYPGLAPKILSYKKRGQSASLLIEHLPGFTFEHVLLKESQALLDESLNHLMKTLRSVWRETLQKKKVQASYMQQLNKRIAEVYRVHPEFESGYSDIGDLQVHSFDSLVAWAQEMEVRLPAPFSVYIHGDFNVDNIIYDPLEQRINFIDLHRSRYMDYVQDVSVFMVSNFRLRILDAPRRRRILRLALEFYRAVRTYARKSNDNTFEIRLALGLARSFVTSTRFTLDKSLARSMFLRGRYLLEKVVATDIDKADRFRLPVKELFHDW